MANEESQCFLPQTIGSAIWCSGYYATILGYSRMAGVTCEQINTKSCFQAFHEIYMPRKFPPIR